jgi:hypothetical protein
MTLSYKLDVCFDTAPFHRAVIVRAGASGGITITGGLDVADPPNGINLLNDVSLMTGRVYFYKIFQLVRVGYFLVLANSAPYHARLLLHIGRCARQLLQAIGQ